MLILNKDSFQEISETTNFIDGIFPESLASIQMQAIFFKEILEIIFLYNYLFQEFL